MKHTPSNAGMLKGKTTSFTRKLLLGSVVVITLIALLLIIGNEAILSAAKKQEEVRSKTVLPLTEMSHLQSQAYKIRVTEANLSQIDDYYAMAAEVESLNRYAQEFEHSLGTFVETYSDLYSEKLKPIHNNWIAIQKSLAQVSAAAGQMQRSEVLALSAYEVQPRFNSLFSLMEKLANQIEEDAEREFYETTEALANHRTNFMLFSVIAMLILIGLLLNFTRYLSGRVQYLHAAFMRVVSVGEYDPIDINGSDELAQLGVAFNSMQEKIASREHALLAAREDLEKRVDERTQQLKQINDQLQTEIDVRRNAEENLRLLMLAVSQSPISIIIMGVGGEIQYANQAVADCSGYSINEIMAGQYPVLGNMQNDPHANELLWENVRLGEEWEGELECMRKDGQVYWEDASVSPVINDSKQITHFLIIKNDITLRKEQERKILHQAHFDALTELPNRALAMDRLAQGVIQAKRNNTNLAVIFIDLDGFKNVNDSLGHDVGDELLIQAAGRLSSAIRKSDTVARLGGDEFLIIMSGLRTRQDCNPVLNKIKDSFAQPFIIRNNQLTVTPSIGISLYPDDGLEGDVLLRNADLAMYQAKDAGRNTYYFFNQSIHNDLKRRLEIENQLNQALESNEFSLLYQPIIDTTKNQLMGVEALIRWHNKVLGHVMPDQFISVAEQSGSIIPIGNWVIKTALKQLSAWRGTLLENITMSINISPQQIQDPALDMVIKTALDEYQVPSHYLMLEVTEGVLIRNPHEAKNNLLALKRLGLQLAMDDFGTGYSSLSNLKNFPFDVLKIDRTFVRDVEKDEDDLALVAAAVNIGRGLGLKVVAEGIENQNQLEIVTDMQCTSAQGYYFSKPLIPSELEQWVKAYHRDSKR